MPFFIEKMSTRAKKWRAQKASYHPTSAHVGRRCLNWMNFLCCWYFCSNTSYTCKHIKFIYVTSLVFPFLCLSHVLSQSVSSLAHNKKKQRHASSNIYNIRVCYTHTHTHTQTCFALMVIHLFWMVWRLSVFQASAIIIINIANKYMGSSSSSSKKEENVWPDIYKCIATTTI